MPEVDFLADMLGTFSTAMHQQSQTSFALCCQLIPNFQIFVGYFQCEMSYEEAIPFYSTGDQFEQFKLCLYLDMGLWVLGGAVSAVLSFLAFVNYGDNAIARYLAIALTVSILTCCACDIAETSIDLYRLDRRDVGSRGLFDIWRAFNVAKMSLYYLNYPVVLMKHISLE